MCMGPYFIIVCLVVKPVSIMIRCVEETIFKIWKIIGVLVYFSFFCHEGRVIVVYFLKLRTNKKHSF